MVFGTGHHPGSQSLRQRSQAVRSATAGVVRVDENGGGKPPPPSGPTRHPFIEGLLKTLPEPETEWKSADRVKWLQTAANIFDLIYKGDGGGISVTAARADRSPRPGGN